MQKSLEDLIKRKTELLDRLSAIRKDLGGGLAADSEEQAIQLENLEVLQEIERLANNELQEVETQIAASTKKLSTKQLA